MLDLDIATRQEAFEKEKKELETTLVEKHG
jgi:hypothetical protein